MEGKYAECKNYHWDCEEMTNVTDGCQEYMASESDPLACVVCGCHRIFHRKVTGYRWDVVYTKCHKVHDLNGECKVDGCREFFPGAGEGSEAALFCATCGCHKGFHRN
ncbi:hypothetical protein CDL12_29675 [Handroanthus impetiginosus]|uniref:ZF-HD dimerization-type domain-containing protein n=1 Tax=Handroanthus impetiginosus TaxID=429701 RepID=A0A2G9FXR1_9LAMI|nr:hypothetical protein CDL12_29675 [Handroanthus impetiginosus]